MRRSRTADEPVLITSAPESSEDEYDRRRKKYAIMMTLRAVAVIAAASTYRVSIWLAMGFVVAGTILPWCAVIIANDGPAKKRRPAPRPAGGNTERALPSGSDDRIVDG
ncbi:MAG TPA: DUF3099 domain-containing protein [Jatrophihabitans sp.]|nr:DUF3099 domain-containing protein [Jatrophihabitans sp.]